MDKKKQEKLKEAGWSIGTAQDFLGLSDAEDRMIRMRVALASELRRQRTRRKVSQAAFATVIGSSQSRVAKMEAGDPSVSLDLLLRSLFVSGSTVKDISKVIANAGVKAEGFVKPQRRMT